MPLYVLGVSKIDRPHMERVTSYRRTCDQARSQELQTGEPYSFVQAPFSEVDSPDPTPPTYHSTQT